MNTKLIIPIAVVVSVIATSGIMYSIGSDRTPVTVSTIATQEIAYVESVSEYFNGTQDIKKIPSQKNLEKIIKASWLHEQNMVNLHAALDRSSYVLAESGYGDESTLVFRDQEGRGLFVRDSVELDRKFSSATQVGGSDYSTTNVQVANVDEPDYLKNDSKYVYIVSESTLSIIDAYPAESAKLILRIALDVESQHIQNMFLNGDRLVIFYDAQSEKEIIAQYGFIPHRPYNPVTHALVVDVSDKENPKILKDYSIDGSFKDARMIGNYAYFVTGNEIDYVHPEFPVVLESSVPVETSDTFYFDNMDRLTYFYTLTAIDVFGDTVNSETFLMGRSGTFYVSEDSLYLTYQQNTPFQFYEGARHDRFFGVIVPLLPDSIQNKIKAVRDQSEDSTDTQWASISEILQKAYNMMEKNDREKLFDKIRDALDRHDAEQQVGRTKTVIHKVSIDGDKMEHVASGSVPGWLLNQFSMDQNGDRLRVATTTEYYTNNRGTVNVNEVHVLDGQLDTVGKLGDIAPDESIYSSRFIGDRLYLVTFRLIDPFFVIDLSADTPKILGELKIPGFSNYLHPYDKDHIIGIGRDVDAESGFVKGVKIALFNVANVSNPRLADEVIIGNDMNTDSGALYDHKAFFFDNTRNILSVPIERYPTYADGQYHQSGFYVFDLDDSGGFSLKGIIEHPIEDTHRASESGRTFYIDDVLYTASEDYLKMNVVDTLEKINSIKLGSTGKFISHLE